MSEKSAVEITAEMVRKVQRACPMRSMRYCADKLKEFGGDVGATIDHLTVPQPRVPRIVEFEVQIQNSNLASASGRHMLFGDSEGRVFGSLVVPDGVDTDADEIVIRARVIRTN